MARASLAWLKSLSWLAGLGLVVLLSGKASATFILTMTEGASSVSVTDNLSPDQDMTPGIISYTGVVGAFTTSITTGYSNSPGDEYGGFLRVATLDARNNTASGQKTLVITLQDTDFTEPPTDPVELDSSLLVTVTRSTAGDSFSFQSYADPSNAQGGTAYTTYAQTVTPVGSINRLTSFSNDADSVFFPRTGNYSLTNTTTVSLSANGQVTITGETDTLAVPEPGALAILGLGAGLILRRRQRA